MLTLLLIPGVVGTGVAVGYFARALISRRPRRRVYTWRGLDLF